MTEEEKKAAEEAAAAELETKIASIVTRHLNGAITAHTKRVTEAFTKSLDERFAKLAPAGEERPAPDAGGKPVDPELKLLREKFEALEKRNAEAENRAKTVEEKARRDAARTTVREQLDAAGIKGLRAAALISHFEATGALRFDDEGQPVFGVKRPRTKGGAAEELTYPLDDIARAMDDWKKSPDAAEFLPPTTPQPAARRPGTATAPARAPTTLADREPTDAEVLQDLSRQGIDLAAAFSG